MKRVAQVDENGCGAACVAIIAGVTYAEGVQRIGTRSYTSGPQIRAALRGYSIELGARMTLKGRRFSDLKQDGLLSARITALRGDGVWSHWMVWDAESQAIIDPRQSSIPDQQTRLTGFYRKRSVKAPA
jgi:hypothetical protein